MPPQDGGDDQFYEPTNKTLKIALKMTFITSFHHINSHLTDLIIPQSLTCASF